MNDETNTAPNPPERAEAELDDGKVEAGKNAGTNAYLKTMVDRNFLEYASYVIKDRAIPDVDDGLKPVQRRVLWALFKAHDGRMHKVANIVGNTMHYHPHGDASIGDALVVLANKDYYILKQGNFGNIITGSSAAAPRYIECSLSPLGLETLFNTDITDFVPSYDGRSEEPVVLPVKIPSLLMLGSDGIAVGMATKVLPHNFNELLNAQISCLKGEPFELYPDFQQGGLMDASEYADGAGKITLRARIEIDGRRLVIREIPATTTTESLIASIEKASEKNKIKISSVTDYTTKEVEIEIVPTRGYDPEKLLQALYMYTDCSVSISSNITVIRERRPTVMTVSEIIKRNTSKLREYLKRELEIALNRQNELFHAKTLAQIFFENRIYKKIEECKTEEAEYKAVSEGLAPFRNLLRRDVTNDDIDKLLALPVRRISRFDIEKNQTELREIERKAAEIRRNLAHLTDYAIAYLQALLAKYGANYPRRTEIEHFDKIDRKAAALNNIKIGWDKRNGYIGTAIKDGEVITCNEFDKILLVRNDGEYRVVALPGNKEFIDRQYVCRKHDPNQEYAIVYVDKKTKKAYGKRSRLGNGILDKTYNLMPPGCKLELFAPRPDAIYEMIEQPKRGGVRRSELNLMELPLRGAKSRGVLIAGFPLTKLAQIRLLTPEELAPYLAAEPTEAVEEENAASAPSPENVDVSAVEPEVDSNAVDLDAEPEAPQMTPNEEPQTILSTPVPESEAETSTANEPDKEAAADDASQAVDGQPAAEPSVPEEPRRRRGRRKKAPIEPVEIEPIPEPEHSEPEVPEVPPPAAEEAAERPLETEEKASEPTETPTATVVPPEPVVVPATAGHPDATPPDDLLITDPIPVEPKPPLRKPRSAPKPEKNNEDDAPLQQEFLF